MDDDKCDDDDDDGGGGGGFTMSMTLHLTRGYVSIVATNFEARPMQNDSHMDSDVRRVRPPLSPPLSSCEEEEEEEEEEDDSAMPLRNP